MPGSEFSTTGSVAVSVLPSPVRISAIAPECRTMPPMSCTSKWRMPICALAGLADDRERLGQQVVELRAVARLLAQRVHPLAQLVVGLELELGLEVVDASDALLELLELLGFAQTQGTVEERHDAEGTNAAGLARRVGGRGWAALRRPAEAGALRASRRRRFLSRWRLTWRASSRSRA